MNNALRTCPGRQGELEGAVCLLEGFGFLLGKDTGDQATGEITDNNAPDPAVGLAQSDEPPKPERSGCIAGNARLGNQLQHTNKPIGRILVIEEHAGNFSSQAGKSGGGDELLCWGEDGNPKLREGPYGWLGRRAGSQSSCRVSTVPGASGLATNACRAAHTSPKSLAGLGFSGWGQVKVPGDPCLAEKFEPAALMEGGDAGNPVLDPRLPVQQQAGQQEPQLPGLHSHQPQG